MEGPIQIDTSAKVSPLVDIEASVRGTVCAIGPNCRVDAFVKIKPVGGSGDVRIGANSCVNSGTVIYSGNGVTIGENVLIGPNCNFAPVNHNYMDKDIPICEQGFAESKGGIVIEDDVWIAAGVTLLDGAHIGKGAVIGANSLVRGRVAAYSINVGNPLKQIGVRSRGA